MKTCFKGYVSHVTGTKRNKVIIPSAVIQRQNDVSKSKARTRSNPCRLNFNIKTLNQSTRLNEDFELKHD